MDPGRRSLGIAPISKGSEPVSVLLSRTICSEKFDSTYPGGGATSVSVCSPHFSSSSRKEPAPGSLSGPVHRLRSAAMQSVITSPPGAVGPFSVHSDSPISSPVSLSVLVHLAEAGLSLLTSSTWFPPTAVTPGFRNSYPFMTSGAAFSLNWKDSPTGTTKVFALVTAVFPGTTRSVSPVSPPKFPVAVSVQSAAFGAGS